MKFGFVIPYASASEFLELAVEIEQAGWDAAFGWETVYGIDPWVVLGGMAALTERVTLGTLLTPPSRRRPWKLASELVTLDLVSNGRALLCAGLGALETGFAQVGEETDRKKRAELMDECLELLTQFWTGKPFEFHGRHYDVDWTASMGEVGPVQQPRIPIWNVGLMGSTASLRRAARWDGVLPNMRDPETGWRVPGPADLPGLLAELEALGANLDTFDIAVEGVTPIGNTAALDNVRGLAENGATWWIESMWETPGGIPAVRERIAAGPPQL
ncbi:MAG: LLM class flavin-dependent oxidoreductase [Thermomicrobiales bacterium]|nr:LLM class flavin-dependent oxidoreductase [Thermomicrobiales bacterium]MCO5221994.1 LLM class flavin-dependent oxidoreductase [Thermomicrobiales bacterium]